MPCLCLLVYRVVYFFPVVLLLGSPGYVAIVRICSTTMVRLLHGFDLLPSGISGKMTVTYYLCYASCLDAIAMSCYLPLVYQASQIAMIASKFFHPS